MADYTVRDSVSPERRNAETVRSLDLRGRSNLFFPFREGRSRKGEEKETKADLPPVFDATPINRVAFGSSATGVKRVTSLIREAAIIGKYRTGGP